MENARRNFLKKLAIIPFVASSTDLFSLHLSEKNKATSLYQNQEVPLWKGFNLLNKFNPHQQTPFSETDFEIIADWGFNFVRLPLSYWCWSSEDNWYSIDEKVLAEIDHAVNLGQQYNIHVNINFHRVPGYCINEDKSQNVSTSLFEDEEPLKACAFHWKTFTERYKGISNKQLSFNLINEAPNIEESKYDKVARHLIKTIRDIDPNRLIFVDGINVGAKPLMTLTDIPNIIQSGRGYQPFLLTHLRASWAAEWPPIVEFPIEEVTWPLLFEGKTHDKKFLREVTAEAWEPWFRHGGKVHIGEFGCHNHTPHQTAIAWLDDLLSVFQELQLGWSLWNLTGSFGVLDSGRKDVKYESFKGYKLDRKMLEVLLKYS